MMAERRMFSRAIISSARFLRMPPTSRLLYYDLGMAADDDGLVEAFTVMRTTGATEDDLRVLVSKGFVTVLNEDLVTYILDWNKNNLIRKDRYSPSIYGDLLVQLSNGQPAVNHLTTDGKPSIGKESIGKDNKGNIGADKPPTRSRFVPPSVEDVKKYCIERDNGIVPEAFVDFYAARGWAIGGSKMRDWKAAIRTWENRRKEEIAGGSIGKRSGTEVPKLKSESDGWFD